MDRKMMVIYKITFPNNKIYIGKDETDSIFYFGSSKNKEIENDLKKKKKKFKIKKKILWRGKTTRKCINKREKELIIKYEANNKKKGYNLRPKWQSELLNNC